MQNYVDKPVVQSTHAMPQRGQDRSHKRVEGEECPHSVRNDLIRQMGIAA